MNCDYITKTNRASLCKNGRLITTASGSYTIRCCNNIEMNLAYNCCNCIRVCAFIKNIGECNLTNVLARFTITRMCKTCNCYNEVNNCNRRQIREVCINCLNVDCAKSVCINLPKLCNLRQLVKVEIIANGNVLKEDTILI